MFTGIIEKIGLVQAIDQTGNTLTVRLESLEREPEIKDSVSINGVCLTVVDKRKEDYTFDVMPETWRRTNLGVLKSGDQVNIELSLTPSSFLGGHFVSGHVDAVVKLLSTEPEENAIILKFAWPEADLGKLIVSQGSVALNGISLTVISTDEEGFTVGIIPHTWEVTNLSELKPGGKVNLEVDMLARYIEKQLKNYK